MGICKIALSLAVLAMAVSVEVPRPGSKVRVLRIKPLSLRSMISRETLLRVTKLFERASRGSIIVNNEADEWIVNLNNYVVSNGKDPSPLHDEGFEFEYTLLLMTYTCTMKLTQGLLTGLSSMKRMGDAILTMNGRRITLTLPATFKDLEFTYSYIAQLMEFGPVGQIDGLVRDTLFTFVVDFDPITLEASLQRFTLNRQGTIKVEFSGNGLLDWMLNILSTGFLTFFYPVFRSCISNRLYELIAIIIDLYNKSICAEFGTCFAH